MIDGGALTVTLVKRRGDVHARLDAPPHTSWTRMLAGRPPVEAARVAGLIVDSCPLAHEAAARAAFGLDPEPGAARLMAQEILREHLFKFFVAWPRAMGWEASPPPVAAADPAAVSLAVFGAAGAPRCMAALERWMDARATPAAKVLRHVWRRWDSRWGRADVPLWRPGDPCGGLDWREAEIDGHPVDTGLAARMADADLLRGIEARRGRGILWRLAARLADCDRLLSGLTGAAPLDEATTIAPGIGAAPSATGLVLVHAELERDRVSLFEQMTPTDCALHPRGVLNRMLASGPHSPDAPVVAVAALTLEAVDPRAPCRLIAPAA